MTAVEIVQVIQTLAVVFLFWRQARVQTELTLLDVTLGAVEREVEGLHRKIEAAAAGIALD